MRIKNMIISYVCECGEYFKQIPFPKDHTNKCLPYLLNNDKRYINVSGKVNELFPVQITYKIDEPDS
jgi:hypothetical protein